MANHTNWVAGTQMSLTYSNSGVEGVSKTVPLGSQDIYCRTTMWPDARRSGWGHVVAVILFLLLAPGNTGRWRLPVRARITREPAHMLSGYDEVSGCSTRHISEAALRHEFATYHELERTEMHDGYLYVGCAIEGDIVVDGKSFRYSENPVNLLSTTWPDGKLHQLGGRHSDDLVGK